jgi:membrane-associated phospholipid phosphatase
MFRSRHHSAHILPVPTRHARRWPFDWSDGLVAVIIMGTYFLSRWFIWGGAVAAFHHARQLLALEHTLGIAPEAAMQQLGLQHLWLQNGADILYLAAHLPLVIGIAFWLRWHHPAAYRWYRTALLGTAAICFVIFIIYPVAPPRFLPGFVDGVKDVGFDVDTSIFSSLYNPYAAMPSLHMSWALLNGWALASYASSRWLKLLGLLWPLVMTLVVLITGNHFMLDVLAGVLVGVVAGVASYAWQRHTQLRLVPPQSQPIPAPAGIIPSTAAE